MSSVAEIEFAIRALPKEEFWKLADWIEELKTQDWSDQMGRDSEAGKLDFLFDEAEASRNSGLSKSRPERA